MFRVQEIFETRVTVLAKIQMVFYHLKLGYDENESHTKDFFFGGGCLLMFHCVWFLIGFLNTNPLDPKHNPTDL